MLRRGRLTKWPLVLLLRTIEQQRTGDGLSRDT
jgi:hypothetical protein